MMMMTHLDAAWHADARMLELQLLPHDGTCRVIGANLDGYSDEGHVASVNNKSGWMDNRMRAMHGISQQQ